MTHTIHEFDRYADVSAALADPALVPELPGLRTVVRPGLSDPDRIAALTATLTVPLNILYTPTGPTVTDLAALGVRRISLGSLLYRNALAAAVTTASAIRDGLPMERAPLSYAEVQALGAPAGTPRPTGQVLGTR